MNLSVITKGKARLRQGTRCAMCSTALGANDNCAHYIHTPGIGKWDAPDNCVMLCNDCHSNVHPITGFDRTIVDPRNYFKSFSS